MLSFAIFANGVMVSVASAMTHNDQAVMQSHAEEHAGKAVHHHSHDDAVVADHHHESETAAVTRHSHHSADMNSKCHDKACQQKCNCGCGMGFCSSTVASLFGSPAPSFLLKGSDAIQSLYDLSFAAARGTSPLRPPIC
ncbi:MAG: hypothetical protein ABI644_14925 [Arenimonas sp.]